MSPKRIRVGSRALGERVEVTVLVYDELEALRKAASAYNNSSHDDTLGVCQVTTDKTDRVGSVIVRLARGHLGTKIVVHEMNHAAVAWYGASVGDRVSRRAHLNHYNEPLAHLQSDLTGALVDRLYDLGYYNKENA